MSYGVLYHQDSPKLTGIYLVSNGQRKSDDIRVIDEFISKHLELLEENLEHTGGHRVRD